MQKIEDHEKLCRIMQKQTFEQIKEMKERIIDSAKMMGLQEGMDISYMFGNMERLLETMKKEIDKQEDL